MNAGILKTQLFNLEKNAQTQERIVLRELYRLDFLVEGEQEMLEIKILRRLRKLDIIQEDIDQIIAKLKEAGEYDPVSFGQNIYEYRSKTKKTFTDRTETKRVRKTKTAWDIFSEQLDGDGQFTVEDIATKLNTDIPTCRAKIKHWQKKGYIETAQKAGGRAIYRRLENHSQLI